MHRSFAIRLLVALTVVALVDTYGLVTLMEARWKINVWVLIVSYYSLYMHEHGPSALFFPALTGLIYDVLGQGIFGAGLVAMLVMGAIMARVVGALDREQWYVQLFVVYLGTLLFMFVELFITCAVTARWLWFGHFGGWLWGIGLATAFSALPVLRLFRTLVGRPLRQYELFSNF